MDVDELDVIDTSERKPSQQLMVAIPAKETSAYRSLSASSFDGTADDGGSNGYETPMTTTNPTPVESDAPKTRRSARVSASARVLQLQNSSFALGGRKRPAQALSRASSPDMTSDAALAKALQAEEFGDESSKRRKISAGVAEKTEIPDSTDEPDDDLVLRKVTPRKVDPMPRRVRDKLRFLAPPRDTVLPPPPPISDSEGDSPLSEFHSGISEASLESDLDDNVDRPRDIEQFSATGMTPEMDDGFLTVNHIPPRVPRRRREFLTRVSTPQLQYITFISSLLTHSIG